MRIVYPYQREVPRNYGYTLAVEPGEPVVAPGDGTVHSIKVTAPGWRFQQAANRRSTVLCIDHGYGVKTYLAGLSALSAVSGSVLRGDVLGYSAAGEIFFAIEIDHSMANPAAINPFFEPRDGSIFWEQPNFMAQAPTVVRRLVTTVQNLLYSGLSYFIPETPTSILFNIAFNGDGSKTGMAVVGNGDDDYWNSYDPVDFFVTGSACYYVYYSAYAWHTTLGHYFNLPLLLPLKDYRQRAAKVFLERVPPLSAFGGSGSSWDSMMARWIGGYSGATPFVNTFRLRGLPAGSYTLYLYAEQGTLPEVSYFQVTVGGTTLTGNTNPTGATSFLQDDNYVAFDVSLGYRSVVEFTSSGYLSGLQIWRNAVL